MVAGLWSLATPWLPLRQAALSAVTAVYEVGRDMRQPSQFEPWPSEFFFTQTVNQ